MKILNYKTSTSKPQFVTAIKPADCFLSEWKKRDQVIMSDNSTTSTSTPTSNHTVRVSCLCGNEEDRFNHQQLYFFLPIILCLMVFSIVGLVVRARARPSDRYLYVLGLLTGDRSIAPPVSRQAAPELPEHGPPPDYERALDMPSPGPKEARVGNSRSPATTRDVFKVFMPESCDSVIDKDTADGVSEYEHVVQVEVDGNTKRNMLSVGEVENVTNCTNEINYGISASTSLGQRRSSENSTATLSLYRSRHGNGQENRLNKSKQKVAVFNLHKMSYDPQCPPGKLPTYGDYANEFVCVHL